MKNKLLVLSFAIAMTPPSAAFAPTVSGRITYLDQDARKLMLDNSDMYAVAPDVARKGLEVGRHVTVDVTSRGTEKVITKVEKYT